MRAPFLRPVLGLVAVLTAVGATACKSESPAPGTAEATSTGGSGTAPRATTGTAASATSRVSTPPGTVVGLPALTGDFCVDVAKLAGIGRSTGAGTTAGTARGGATEDVEPILAYLEALRREAPSSLDGPMGALIDTLRKVTAVPADDPDALDKVLGLMFDPGFLSAQQAINDYGRGPCGLTTDVIPHGGSSGGGSPSDTGGDKPRNDTMERLEQAYGSTDWWQAKNGYAVSDLGRSVDITLFGSFTRAQALAACRAAVEVASTTHADVTVKIAGDGPSASPPLARTDPSGVCVEG